MNKDRTQIEIDSSKQNYLEALFNQPERASVRFPKTSSVTDSNLYLCLSVFICG